MLEKIIISLSRLQATPTRILKNEEITKVDKEITLNESLRNYYRKQALFHPSNCPETFSTTGSQKLVFQESPLKVHQGIQANDES